MNLDSRAVLFDFDGTLTRPCLDFDRIRAEIGIASGPILEAISLLEGAARRRAEEILDRHEREACERAELHAGAAETLLALHGGGFRTAIVTRNARRYVLPVMERFGLAVDFIRSREDGEVKPSPEPVLAACAGLGVAPARSWMVGDHLMDLVSGRSAGTRTVLMLGEVEVPSARQREWMAEAHHVVRRLAELPPLVGAG